MTKLQNPNLASPMVGKDGIPIRPWREYLVAISADPSAIVPVVLGASPFDYEIVERGAVSIVGGTVSAVTLIRGQGSAQVIMPTGMTSGLFPVCSADTLRITYTVPPTVNLIPGN